MRIAEVIGKVTLSRWHASLEGASWKLGVPLSHTALNGDASGRGEAFVIYDALGAGEQSLIAVSEGAEAAAPFQPKIVPLDAYNAAILDRVVVD
jgi:ethanolamine utilization protein EutN